MVLFLVGMRWGERGKIRPIKVLVFSHFQIIFSLGPTCLLFCTTLWPQWHSWPEPEANWTQKYSKIS